MKMIPETVINHRIGWILLAAALVLAGGCSRSKGNAVSCPCEEILLGEFEERSFDSYLEARREQVSVVRLDSSLVLDSGRGLAGPDGKMLVADRKMRQLTVLSLLDGRRLGAVGAFGRAENEYLQVTGFDFDADGNIWLLDARGKCLLEYDGGDFAFKQRKNIGFGMPMDVKCLDKGGFLFFMFPEGKDPAGLPQLIRTDSRPKTIGNILSFSGDLDSGNLLMARSFSAAEDAGCYSADMYVDDYVTRLDADGTPMKQYRFHFGKYRIPDEVRSSISSHAGDFERYRCVCAPVYVSDLTACGQLFDRGAYSFFLADREEKVLYIPGEHPESISLLDCGNGRMYLFLDGMSDSPYRSALGLSPSDGDCIAILRLTE